MILPKIIYNPGSGPVTLSFTLPPVQKPYAWTEATRTDSISTSGVKQSILIREDNFFALTMNYCAIADLAAWLTFMSAWALTGGQFDYYPDATLGTHTTYTIEETTFKPEFVALGYYKFALTFRQWISG